MKISFVKQIEEIEKQLSFTNSSSLLGGNAGLILFYIYYYKATGNEKYLEIANKQIECEIENLAFDNTPVDFGSGMTGLFWLLLHCQNSGYIELPTDFFANATRETLAMHSDRFLEDGYFDYFYGGLSSCMFFLEDKSDFADEQLQKIVLKLQKKAVIKHNLCYWPGTFFTEKKLLNNEINFGLAHGIPSVVIILCKIFKRGIEKEVCHSLISGAINYIADNALNGQQSMYPDIVVNNTPPHASRLAWCYGDLGIAVTYWQAGKITLNADWQQHAIKIMRFAAERRNLTDNLVKDACVCHGTSGIALIFYRFYVETGENQFKDAADFWFERTLIMAEHSTGIAGYKNWTPQDGYLNTLGMLEGVSGIGLCLLSAAYDMEPYWDSCLLLS